MECLQFNISECCEYLGIKIGSFSPQKYFRLPVENYSFKKITA
jgi:hypothetical protein